MSAKESKDRKTILIAGQIWNLKLGTVFCLAFTSGCYVLERAQLNYTNWINVENQFQTFLASQTNEC
jgi:hypothetical protein